MARAVRAGCPARLSTLTFKGDCKGLSVCSGILLEGSVSFVAGDLIPPRWFPPRCLRVRVID